MTSPLLLASPWGGAAVSTPSEIHVPASQWGQAVAQFPSSTFISTDLMPNWQIERPGTNDPIRTAMYLPAGTWAFFARHYAVNGEGEAAGAIILLSLNIRRGNAGDIYGNGTPPAGQYVYRSAVSGYFPATRPGNYSIIDHPLAQSVVAPGGLVSVEIGRLTSDGINTDTQAAGGFIRFVEMIAKKV